jgi:hypothetical protein
MAPNPDHAGLVGLLGEWEAIQRVRQSRQRHCSTPLALLGICVIGKCGNAVHQQGASSLPSRMAQENSAPHCAKHSWFFRFADRIVGDGQAMHRLPDQVHLSSEVSARFSYCQMHAHAHALNQRQIAIHAFRHQAMYFFTGRFQSHITNFCNSSSRLGWMITEPF